MITAIMFHELYIKRMYMKRPNIKIEPPKEKPTWRYRYVTIPNLETIQSELYEAFNIVYDNDVNQMTPDYVFGRGYIIEEYLPKTKEFLNELGILDRWAFVGFVTGNKGESLPLHVDTLDWKRICYGLNIPVLNCEKTYTAFYDAQVKERAYSDKERKTAHICDEETAIEIDRVECDRPMWINHTIPHKPIMTHEKPRIMASLRFFPEVHDLLGDDYVSPNNRE